MPLSVTNTITDFQKMGIKFIRRPDLNSSKRLHIATTALFAMLIRPCFTTGLALS